MVSRLVAGNELFVTASTGIAVSTPGLAPADLMRNADIAMYDAKRRGRSRCSVFDESMHRRVVDRRAVVFSGEKKKEAKDTDEKKDDAKDTKKQ